MRISTISKLIPALMIGAVIAIVGYANWRDARSTPERTPPDGALGISRTSRDGLSSTVEKMDARLATNPYDSDAAVKLAQALLRQTRVLGNAGLARKAEATLLKVLSQKPDDYLVRQTLAETYLSEHRFSEAAAEAERTRAAKPRDMLNYGIIGDANIELGEYDKAFDAFDTMAKTRPSAASYARVAYARELQGNMSGALDAMKMAAEATTAHDPESQAWHYAQVAELYLQMGRFDEAEEQLVRAQASFRDHPFVVAGAARLKVVRGEYRDALRIYQDQLAKTPTADLEMRVGDLLARLGDAREAERHYALAEVGWKFDTPDPTQLARFLADRHRKPEDALKVAESAAAVRHDIFTMDALAWAYFGAGRIADAAKASKEALRTGSRDRLILYHAAAIKHATGDDAAARPLLEAALGGSPEFDPIVAPQAKSLLETLKSGQMLASR